MLDERSIACSLNYGAALRRGMSEDVDKMNLVPRFPLLMNCGNGGRCDMLYHPRFSFSNTSRALHEMFIIVINILSGSGALSDTWAWKELIKRSYCLRSP